jgi:hypothetical protein
MSDRQANEYLKTIGTVAISLVLMATALGMAVWHIIQIAS